MVCEHLHPLENELKQKGFTETYRGQAWSQNCREWVYFNCILDLDAIQRRLQFPDFVQQHVHRGTHDGAEAGFVCTKCNDGVMGLHPSMKSGNLHFS